VPILTKDFRFCVETDSVTKLKVPSMFDRNLLMKNHPVHRFCVSLNKKCGNSYAADLGFYIFMQNGLLEKLNLMQF